MSRRAAPLLLTLGLLAACATQEWTYDKTGVTPAQLDRDMAACRREATDPKAFAIFAEQRIDRKVFNPCMERKGYTVKALE